MKKKFLFSMLAILLAGFGFGGVSLADAVACVEGGLCYDTLADAISNANDGGTIILQSSITNVSGLNFEKTLTIQASGNNITLTGAANDSNKNTILGTVAAGKTVTFVGVKFDLTAVKYANAGYAAGFNLASTAGGNVGGAENKGTVAFSNCTFDGRLTVVGKATFDGCTFNYDPVEAYQVEIRSRDNVSFSNCTFNGGDRNINIYDPTHTDLSSENTKITFSSCTFTAPSAVKKGAIVIHEQREGSNLDKFNVVVTNATKNGTYPATPYSGETRAKMYSNGLIMVDDYNTGVVTSGGDVVVSVDGTEVYANPEVDANGMVIAKIGETKYYSLQSAISGASDGGTITLLSDIMNVNGLNFDKTLRIQALAGREISIVAAANNSNKNTILGTVEPGNTVTFNGIKFNLLNVKYVNAGYAAGFNLASTAGGNVGGAENKGTVAFSNCTFDGRLTVVGKATFDGCTFNYDPVEAYQVEVRSRDSVSFNNCIFSGRDRNINIYDHTHQPLSANATITFSNSTFIAQHAVKKGAIVIHEQREGSNLDKFNVVVTNATLNGTYPATPHSDETRAKMYSNGLIMVDDYNTGVVTEGGDVVVYFNGSKVYSNPKIEAGGVIATRTVTFDGSGVTIEDGAKLDRPADPTKSCYRFDGWYDGNNAYDFNSVVTSDLTLTSHWTYNCGGGSSSSRPSNNTSSNTGNNNTGTNNTGTVNTGTVNTGTVETGTNNEEIANQEELKNPEQQDWYDNNGDQQEVLENGLTREMNNAYEFAYRAGITTMETIEDAKMEEGLTRIAMAKMLSQYAINVLGKTPADIEVPAFEDVPAELDAQYDNGVTLAYKLGIMGQNMPNNKFLPNDLVTRAQFGTALSRLLFGIEDGEDAYYTTHLAKLKDAGIISNDDPTLEELRGYVMLMLMRSAK